MRLHKVYHRFSLLPLSPPSLLHHHPLKPPSSSSLSLKLSRSSPIHMHSKNAVKSIRKSMTTTASTRFHNLVVVNAEDGGGGTNGSLSSSSTSNTHTAQDEELALDGGYRLPPPEIRDIVDAPPLPALSFSPHRDKILFLKRRSLPPLTDLAIPEEKLAGIRIDGKCNTRSRMSFYTGIGIHQLMHDGTLGPEVDIHGLPDDGKINFVTW